MAQKQFTIYDCIDRAEELGLVDETTAMWQRHAIAGSEYATYKGSLQSCLKKFNATWDKACLVLQAVYDPESLAKEVANGTKVSL